MRFWHSWLGHKCMCDSCCEHIWNSLSPQAKDFLLENEEKLKTVGMSYEEIVDWEAAHIDSPTNLAYHSG